MTGATPRESGTAEDADPLDRALGTFLGRTSGEIVKTLLTRGAGRGKKADAEEVLSGLKEIDAWLENLVRRAAFPPEEALSTGARTQNSTSARKESK